jgi:hypothetical protein
MCARAPLSTYARHLFSLPPAARRSARAAVGDAAWRVIRRQLDAEELEAEGGEKAVKAIEDDRLQDLKAKAAERKSQSKAKAAAEEEEDDGEQEEEEEEEEEEDDHDADALGAGLYVLGCCMNHSCRPNISL